ncbi:MAG TPA: 50S ribosomal protein L11 methyltransferase [bacterium]|nr:50S ribosomal protein L11 methyltransferase [bacterium]
MNTRPQHWIEVTISCPEEALEAVSNFLFENGASGTEERPGVLAGFFPQPADPENLAAILLPYLRILNDLGFEVGEPEFRIVPREDWGESWRQHFKPIQATPNILIKPPWETVETESTIVIDIMPRMAFGTGSHETTRLCLSLMEGVLKPGQSVLDLGSGSGILAVAAVRLGAERVTAVDIDPDAIDNLYENADLNGVEDRIDIRLGSLEAVAGERFDLILANLHRKALEQIFLLFPDHIHPESRLILSGILDTEERLIEEMLGRADMLVLAKRRLGEWLGYLTGIRKGPTPRIRDSATRAVPMPVESATTAGRG